MTREQLQHLIRAACDVLDVDEVLVIGSQAILASWTESELPNYATRSLEADIARLGDFDGTSSESLAGILGEDSGFHRSNGYFVDGVSDGSAQLPEDWRSRAVRLESYSVVRSRTVAGICPDPVDLCASKLCALREKDMHFVEALIAARLVPAGVLKSRLATIPDLDPVVLDRAVAFVTGIAEKL